MSAIANITSEGQATISQEIRALLNVKPGDLFTLEQRLLRGVPGRPAAEDEAGVRMGLARLLGWAMSGKLQESVAACVASADT